MQSNARNLGWLMSFVVIAGLAGIFAPAAAAQKYFVYVGTYTEHGSEGIYVCDFDAETGRLGAPVLAASDPPSKLPIGMEPCSAMV